MSTAPLIRTLQDIQQIESTPLSDRGLPESTFDLIRRTAQTSPHAPALSFILQGTAEEAPLRLNYTELLGKITQTANAFHRLGLRPGKAVSFLLPNLPQTHYTIWGGEAAGIVNAINPLLDAEHIAELIHASDSELLVTLAPFPGTDLWDKVNALRDQLPELKAILCVDMANLLPEPQRSALKAQRGPLPEGVLDFDETIAACPADHLESGRLIAADDIASYFHTGGTTGTPKLAPHSHGNEVAMAYSMNLVTRFGAGDVTLCGLPLFHVNGVIVTGLAAFIGGAEVLLATPQGYRNTTLIGNFWKVIERHKVSFFSGVPTIYAGLLQIPSEGHDLSSLKYALCGAAPMPVELIRQFEAKTGLTLLEGYGLTEGTCGSCANPPAGERRPGSIGLPMPYCEVRIKVLDEQGRYLRDAEQDEIGNLCIRGATVFRGYLQASKNADIWVDGDWFNTGDLGRVDADGYIWLTGRSKDLIIRGGHNIDPQMIEEALHKHPAVAMAAAVGKPDEKAGELPVVYVQLKPGAQTSETELLEHAAAHIPERAAVPKDAWIIDAIPLTAVGKTFKPALRFDAIARVYQAAIDELHPAVRVEVLSDDRAGQLAHIHLPNQDQALAASIGERLSGYAVGHRIHFAA
ncbi:acyl-CoA synthetase [Pseudomonas oleovorans]|uniref:AMP-binding domain-containing protein n=1 Tax=Ectopseudomonas oleovorans TaxID=301 RepID=A0A379JNL0_ECTOL|nr:acyl-CoA synthetase [Pseudomonas oleovorans]MDH1338235.1 acyl-CoA synthetase [Pseudomonas oleovorans]MDH1494127.1 acyl-CoA synthetase [Pseudomonas oleovorans]OWK37084.1 Long-chain-fatty-acid--CoA ligase [Pseudomonas oleovorans subsp. oleovorans]WGG20159.1 acyl-CoA synthetase [Pseudomonas oleovorans]SEJ95927.1 fatty-acyl-CoA synthase [Pseudomonas oleovorans]